MGQKFTYCHVLTSIRLIGIVVWSGRGRGYSFYVVRGGVFVKRVFDLVFPGFGLCLGISMFSLVCLVLC